MGQTLLQQVRLSSGFNIIAALWLIVSPYGFGYYLRTEPFWNSVIIGVAVAFFAILRVATPFRFPEISWANFVLGAWLIASPFLFRFTDIDAALWNSVLTGLFFMAMAVWSGLAGKRGQSLLP